MVIDGKAYVTLDMTNLCPFVRIVLDSKNLIQIDSKSVVA